MKEYLFLIITLLIVGAVVWFVNKAPAVADWVKWLINGIAFIGCIVYAANVIFGYSFPGM